MCHYSLCQQLFSSTPIDPVVMGVFQPIMLSIFCWRSWCLGKRDNLKSIPTPLNVHHLL
jgi:hypothetical protein